MPENEVVNHRLEKLEEDVKILYKKTNDVTLAQVQSVTKLDSMLISCYNNFTKSITRRRPLKCLY